MPINRLNVITVSSPEPFTPTSPSVSSRTMRTQERRAQFERLWLQDPTHFNPLRNCMERERLERTWLLLTHHTSITDKQVADIGCAAGVFSFRLREGGAAHVTAVDIAENALKYVHAQNCQNMSIKREAMPVTALPDHQYDIIVCTEVIADLPREDYRLFFAELSRLIQPEGYLVCSSAIDINSEGGMERLKELAQTEFEIMQAVPSYHALSIRLKHFLEKPKHLIESWQDPKKRAEELAGQQGLSRLWFWLQTSFVFIWISYAVEPLTRPLRHLLKNNRFVLLHLEKLCRFLSDETGISNYLFIAKRRTLQTIDPQAIPIEKPRRKEIWD